MAVLCKLGFPREHLFTHKQADVNAFQRRKKLTHWAVTCKHPFMDVLESYHKYNTPSLKSLGDVDMVSINGFALYTRDIVFYYLMALRKYTNVGMSGPTKVERQEVLANLQKVYEKEFGHDLRTPGNPTARV